MHSSPRRPAHGGVSSCNGNNAQRISTSQALGRAACSRPTPLRAPGVRPRSVSRCRDVPAVRHIGRQHFQYSGRELPPERIVSHEVIHFFGMRCRVPVVTHWAGTVIAVNVGGAVIPTLMSVYLLIKRELWVKGLIATAVVALVIHWMADPVPGLGIAVPIFMPVLVTAIVAVILTREESAPLAYIAGSLGTLIGADLTNLDKVRGLGAPVASIGGAGTFDGIFLTGILAVLLASLYARPRAAHAR